MVTLETRVNRYIGLSTDQKPQPGDMLRGTDGTISEIKEGDMPAGSSFLCADTGEIYRWSGSEWLYSPSAEVRAMQRVTALLEEANDRAIHQL